MLAAESYLNSVSVHEAASSEIHSSKIALHHAKTDYGYPTTRLPYTLSKLAGLSTHIYQTVHQERLPFS